jgi:hypothetical protein
VLPLPEEGRPLEFGGAVGRFSVSADVAKTEVETGQSLALVLRIEGLREPRGVSRRRGSRAWTTSILRGTIDDKGASRRTITYDLAPASVAVKESPGARVAYFDPEPPAGYRTSAHSGRSRSESARRRPRPAASARPRRARERALEPEARVRRSTFPSPSSPRWAQPQFLIVRPPPGRVSGSRSGAPRGARAGRGRVPLAQRAARREPRRRVRELPGGVRGRSGRATLKVRDLPALLERAGAPTELARRASALLEAQLAARSRRRSAGRGGAAELRALVDALDECVQRPAAERAAARFRLSRDPRRAPGGSVGANGTPADDARRGSLERKNGIFVAHRAAWYDTCLEAPPAMARTRSSSALRLPPESSRSRSPRSGLLALALFFARASRGGSSRRRRR